MSIMYALYLSLYVHVCTVQAPPPPPLHRSDDDEVEDEVDGGSMHQDEDSLASSDSEEQGLVSHRAPHTGPAGGSMALPKVGSVFWT